MSAKLEPYRDNAGEWRWRLVGGNGEKMAASESYPDRDGAVRGIQDAIEAVEEAAEEWLA